MLYGGVQHNPPSRFISEIGASYELGAKSFGQNTQDLLLGTHDSREPRYIPDINEGDQVHHQLFGEGTVMEKEGDVAIIYFKGKGSKKLDVSFAPLEKI